MGVIKELESGSAVYGHLPTGCQLCRKGSKLVLLVTGKCGKNCFYCPLSGSKKGRDCLYADEMPVEKDEDVLTEAKLIRAEGTGITGGDPLFDIDRTERYLRLIKDNFGASHHVHLYTCSMEPEKVERLVNAGLDEVRFHPPPDKWGSMEEYSPGIAHLLDLSVDVGVE
ncbi:MAG: radical SAM protein, partial [Candidatus Thermoplasmatota archaeon]|nr:radical SAM protein [Candidatus Thermoplasmatota archaeon]